MQEHSAHDQLSERRWELGFTAGDGEAAACAAMMFARTLDASCNLEGGAEDEETNQQGNPLRGGVLKHLQVPMPYAILHALKHLQVPMPYAILHALKHLQVPMPYAILHALKRFI